MGRFVDVEENQASLHEDVELYFGIKNMVRDASGEELYLYTKKGTWSAGKEGVLPDRNLRWLKQKKEWKGFKSIVMGEKTISTDT